ncbi:hypothetical protein C942_04536 [Photobacterium marinum]|uniref:Uncharacterized protein n=1 Tax=Photobacterium marinum TaxID=1056511 RepID=L8JHC9_9GAMM|nr:hypothetical protein C942_04536 [Photobacterium marinum]
MIEEGSHFPLLSLFDPFGDKNKVAFIISVYFLLNQTQITKKNPKGLVNVIHISIYSASGQNH